MNCPEAKDTLLLMRIHQKIDEFGGCLLWNSTTNACGHPKLDHKSARRILWKIVRGPIPPGMFVTTCSNRLCMACLRLVSKGEISKKTMANPVTQLKRRASGARANRERFGKLTMDLAEQIRASTETGKVWAERLKVSASLISKVRAGKTWVAHSGNPFAGLLRP